MGQNPGFPGDPKITQNGHFGHFGVTPQIHGFGPEIHGFGPVSTRLGFTLILGYIWPIFGLNGPYLAQNGPK